MEVLAVERRRLFARLEQEREQLERLESIVASISERIQNDERMLSEINCVLGKSSQMRLDQADIRLRGRQLEEVAILVLTQDRGSDEQVHYREWFALLRSHGHLVAGKHPLNTFLAQINRSPAVEKIGGRTGLYRLAQAA
jgi:hypothetical protein